MANGQESWPSKMRWMLQWAALAAVLAGPPALATHQGPADVNAHDLNVLVYHPMPDEQGDPWGIAAANVEGRNVDWMAGYYGAYFFPTAVFDGVEKLESTPLVEGEGAFRETYNGYRAALERRLRSDAPVSIRVEAVLAQSVLRTDVEVRALGILDEPGLVLRVVLFEDEVVYSGGNGIVNHRFVVRSIAPATRLDLADGSQSVVHEVGVPSFVDAERLGLVAFVQNTNEASALFKPKEVVQSATWTTRQEGPTVQVARGVLLELYSATWCAACVYGDTAADTLADEFGIPGLRTSASGFEYLRPADPVRVGAALALGASGAAWAFWPRRRKGEAS